MIQVGASLTSARWLSQPAWCVMHSDVAEAAHLLTPCLCCKQFVFGLKGVVSTCWDACTAEPERCSEIAMYSYMRGVGFDLMHCSWLCLI